MFISMSSGTTGWLSHPDSYMDKTLKLSTCSHLVFSNMVLPGKQPGLVASVVVPAALSTLVVIARSMRKVKRRPDYISKTGAIAAETLLIASVVCVSLMMTHKDSRTN
jgi:hypothetical protein